jgi:hypothetical protein
MDQFGTCQGWRLQDVGVLCEAGVHCRIVGFKPEVGDYVGGRVLEAAIAPESHVRVAGRAMWTVESG